MDLGITIGLAFVVLLIAVFLVYFIKSALNMDDASRVDQPPQDTDFKS